MAKPTSSVSKVRDVAKSAPATAVATTEVRNVAKFELTGSLVELVKRLGVDLGADLTPDERLDRASLNLSRSAQYMLAAGLDLVALQAQCEHGTFLPMIEERGFSKDAAYRAISYAKFVGSRSPDEQVRLLELPKSKVLELAKADPMVVDVLMQEDGPIDMSAMNVRDMQARIKELERAMVDTKVELKTAETERDAAHRRLAKSINVNRDDHVPMVIADLRAELVLAQLKMTKLVEQLYPLATDLMSHVGGDAHDWVEPTATLGLSGLLAAHHALGEQIKAWAKGFNVEPVLHDVGFDLTDREVLDLAKFWDMATRHADYEKTLREYERSKDRPRGKGRPTGKPEAPADYVGGKS